MDICFGPHILFLEADWRSCTMFHTNWRNLSFWVYINGYSARKANRRSLVKVGTSLQLHHGPEDSLVVIIEYEVNYNEANLTLAYWKLNQRGSYSWWKWKMAVRITGRCTILTLWAMLLLKFTSASNSGPVTILPLVSTEVPHYWKDEYIYGLTIITKFYLPSFFVIFSSSLSLPSYLMHFSGLTLPSSASFLNEVADFEQFL